jgi:anti-anti-sigma factor
MDKYKCFEVQKVGDVSIVHLVDQKLLDRLLIYEMHDELLAFLEKERPLQLIVNFGPVTHCSTEVIGGLLRVNKRLKSSGGKLKLCGMSDSIREVYRIMNLDGTIFDIYESAADAVKAF